MSKHFRPWNIDQTLLLPPNVRDFVPKDHVSRFIVGLVRESLDLKAIMCSYVSGLGQPPFALCAHYPERYVALVEQPGPNPTATTFVDCSVIDDSVVAINSFCEFAATEGTSQRGEARFEDSE